MGLSYWSDNLNMYKALPHDLIQTGADPAAGKGGQIIDQVTGVARGQRPLT